MQVKQVCKKKKKQQSFKCLLKEEEGYKMNKISFQLKNIKNKQIKSKRQEEKGMTG